MITAGIASDGTIQTKRPEPWITQALLQQLLLLQLQEKTRMEIIDYLRLRTVPEGYFTHPWTEGDYIIVHNTKYTYVNYRGQPTSSNF